MKSNTIDRLNVLLILVSLILAFLFPFKLFLFSYAVLGPLHYLTEINWLKKNDYFIKAQKWIWVFILLAFIISIPSFLNLSFFSNYSSSSFIQSLNITITGLTDIFLLTLLFFAIGLVYFKKWQHLLFFLIISLVLAKLITKYILFSYILVGIFLPTIIHVYLFTLLFMIRGALISKNKAGIAGIILMLIIPIIIFVISINPAYYITVESSTVINTARNFRFIQYLTTLFETTDMVKSGQLSMITTKVQIFTAFCYTYHYLNWFSKTSVIGWHKNMSKPRLLIIFLAWLIIILLFWYDYETAYLALFFLAILHIILEFPLNIISIKEIIAKITYRNKSISN